MEKGSGKVQTQKNVYSGQKKAADTLEHLQEIKEPERDPERIKE
jgi:hypothetical protein